MSKKDDLADINVFVDSELFLGVSLDTKFAEFGFEFLSELNFKFDFELSCL